MTLTADYELEDMIQAARKAEREKVLNTLDDLYTECLFLSNGSVECSAICDKVRGVLGLLRQEGKVEK